MRPKYELATILHRFEQTYLDVYSPSVQVKRTFTSIKACRTSKLGGHKKGCKKCGTEQISYNSCRNRHCPKCQAVAKERWIMAREAELLDVPYFHIVFTLPHELNSLALHKPKEVYNALFRASWKTIAQFASDPKHLGAKTGMTSVLHTWGQNLSLHPHLHCIVPAGGICSKGKWILPKKAKSTRKTKYLFPKRALSKVFRAKYMAELRKEITIPQATAKTVMSKDWVVYAKRPFMGPKQVVEYLGRYTHKIAISNHRLLEITDKRIVFKYKNYKTGEFNQQMSLAPVEFIRRYAQHILPHGFVRIRHNGILASRNKRVDLNKAKEFFNLTAWEPKCVSWEVIAKQKLRINPNTCPKCKLQSLELLEVILPERGPPKLRKQTITLPKSNINA